MCPYRTNAATIRADTLEQLFATRSNLKADDGLGVSYRFLPWKRHVYVVCWQPASLAEYFVALGAGGPVSIDVLRSDELTAARYGVARRFLTRHTLPSDDVPAESHAIELLERVRAAHVRARGLRFALGDGQLRFEVSGYELDELGARFRQSYPWDRLDLPALTGREWLVLDRPS